MAWTRVELRAMGLVFALLYVLNTIAQERRGCIGCIGTFFCGRLYHDVQ